VVEFLLLGDLIFIWWILFRGFKNFKQVNVHRHTHTLVQYLFLMQTIILCSSIFFTS